ncbi:MepB family protein [Devosia sp.]|uniref:MepB family protein n=1 Tax=Devosia sp. TaxID=1871048 RepID=UPI002FC9B57E
MAAVSAVYEPTGIELTKAPWAETESAEYGACRLSLNGAQIVYRVAKTTPTKVGQFVTIWKRPDPGGPIAPLDSADGVALVIIHVSDGARSGQFIFDKSTLIKRGVMSVDGKGGKRAIRVYPPWTTPTAKDAISTQRWQLGCFLPLHQTAGTSAIERLFASILPG